LLDKGVLTFFGSICRKGGEKAAQAHGFDFYREIGRKGGESPKEQSNSGSKWFYKRRMLNMYSFFNIFMRANVEIL
jgi:hypothetical protein